MCKEIAKPFLKWAGGKGQLINTFDEMFPNELKEGKIKTYIEPFVGGGAVLFHVLQNYDIEKAYINDINKELINCYRCIKADVNEVIKQLEILEKESSFIHLVFHAPRVKSGISTGMLPFNTDFSLNSVMQDHSAASYTSMSRGRPLRRQYISR